VGVLMRSPGPVLGADVAVGVVGGGVDGVAQWQGVQADAVEERLGATDRRPALSGAVGAQLGADRGAGVAAQELVHVRTST
jgi:hypothetical protein